MKWNIVFINNILTKEDSRFSTGKILVSNMHKKENIITI